LVRVLGTWFLLSRSCKSTIPSSSSCCQVRVSTSPSLLGKTQSTRLTFLPSMAAAKIWPSTQGSSCCTSRRRYIISKLAFVCTNLVHTACLSGNCARTTCLQQAGAPQADVDLQCEGLQYFTLQWVMALCNVQCVTGNGQCAMGRLLVIPRLLLGTFPGPQGRVSSHPLQFFTLISPAKRPPPSISHHPVQSNGPSFLL
jgi:hypothetical protein